MSGMNSTRFQFWQGQSLRSRDFNDQLDAAEQLRWLHNRAVHLTFGVSFGLTVKRGQGQSLTLQCGLAYDCFGRELAIPRERTLTPPPSGAPQYLSLRWNGAGGEVFWLPGAQLGASPGVLLARLKADGSLDTGFHALQSRALRRPRLSSGATPPGNTPWEKLISAHGTRLGLQTRIDTSAAGFTDKPFYQVSLVWAKRNDRFTPPYVTIADATASGFAVRLLLQGIGEESFEVVSDIKTVSQSEWTSHAVGSFLPDDMVARVLPRASSALRIDAAANTGSVLTLAGGASSLGFKRGDSVALLNLPRSPLASTGVRAIQVADTGPFPAGTFIMRKGGASAGSVTTVSSVSGGLLFPNAEIAGLQVNDNLSIVREAGKVDSVDGVNVKIVGSAAKFKPGASVVRLSANVEAEVPVTMVKISDNDPKIVELSAAIPDLKANEVLGVSVNGAAVAGFVDTLTTPAPEQFREGDVLGFGAQSAIVQGVDGNRLLLRSPLAVPAGGQVSIGDYGGRSTISGAPANAQQIPVRDASPFVTGDLVALLKGTARGAAAISRVTGFAGSTLQVAPGLDGASGTDVVAVVRMSSTSTITSAAPLKVADPTRFRAGDMVTKAADPRIVCAEIREIHADGAIVLRGSDIVPGVGEPLNVVFAETIATISADPAGNSITIDQQSAARVGWFAAAPDRWVDATVAVDLTSFPDGTLPGDSIGFAALSQSQPVLRFASSVNVVPPVFLFVQGPDELTGAPQNLTASLEDLNANKQARLRFFVATPFKIRPEQLGVTAAFPSTLTDDFAAYAQQQGLSVCWIGSEIPHPQPEDCPGLQSSSCPCQ
jgi:hypothetical protein